MLTAPLLLAAALAPADAPTTPPDAAVSDAGDLQGEWEVVEVNSDRRDLTFSCKGQRRYLSACHFRSLFRPSRPSRPAPSAWT